MIENPSVKLNVSRSPHLQIEASDEDRQKILKTLTNFVLNSDLLDESFQLDRLPFHFLLDASIPEHVGLGSGTQLALAIGRSLQLLRDDSSKDMRDLARQVGRGLRSGIGLHGFALGGFLIDAGKVSDSLPASLKTRMDFPPAWRFVLIRPVCTQGLSGKQEWNSFQTANSIPLEEWNRLYTLLTQNMIESLSEQDFPYFSDSLFQYNLKIGSYFAPFQSGEVVHPQMKDLFETIQETGIRGVGQSSWGPTLFALCDSQCMAELLINELKQWAGFSERFHLEIAKPLNHGATIHCES